MFEVVITVLFPSLNSIIKIESPKWIEGVIGLKSVLSDFSPVNHFLSVQGFDASAARLID